MEHFMWLSPNAESTKFGRSLDIKIQAFNFNLKTQCLIVTSRMNCINSGPKHFITSQQPLIKKTNSWI